MVLAKYMRLQHARCDLESVVQRRLLFHSILKLVKKYLDDLPTQPIFFSEKYFISSNLENTNLGYLTSF